MFMKSNNSFSKVKLAALAAGFIIFAHGIAYYGIAARLPMPGKAPRIAPDALDQFPLQIVDWMGEDIPIDEEIISRTGSDSHINRRYIRENGLDSVLLYATCGAQIGSMIGHRPDICYTNSGWKIVEQNIKELPLNDDKKLPCTIFLFEKNNLRKEQIVNLNYFIADGVAFGDSSSARSRAGYRLAEVSYIIQVQVIGLVRSNESIDSVIKRVSDFAVDAAIPIEKLSDEIRGGQTSSQFAGSLKGI